MERRALETLLHPRLEELGYGIARRGAVPVEGGYADVFMTSVAWYYDEGIVSASFGTHDPHVQEFLAGSRLAHGRRGLAGGGISDIARMVTFLASARGGCRV